MLEYMFSHSFFGLCAWDLPALIVLIAMIVVFVVHRHNMKKGRKISKMSFPTGGQTARLN